MIARNSTGRRSRARAALALLLLLAATAGLVIVVPARRAQPVIAAHIAAIEVHGATGSGDKIQLGHASVSPCISLSPTANKKKVCAKR